MTMAQYPNRARTPGPALPPLTGRIGPGRFLACSRKTEKRKLHIQCCLCDGKMNASKGQPFYCAFLSANYNALPACPAPGSSARFTLRADQHRALTLVPGGFARFCPCGTAIECSDAHPPFNYPGGCWHGLRRHPPPGGPFPSAQQKGRPDQRTAPSIFRPEPAISSPQRRRCRSSTAEARQPRTFPS